MRARPDWLSNEMLAEMRRLKGSSRESPCRTTDVFYSFDMADFRAHKDERFWWLYSNEDDSQCWLTAAGHEALAAIELKEMAASPLLRNFIPPAPVAGWTKDWPSSPGWWWLRSSHWVPEHRSRPVECVDADGCLEYVSNTGTHVLEFSGIVPGEHWLWHRMDSPPPEPPP